MTPYRHQHDDGRARLFARRWWPEGRAVAGAYLAGAVLFICLTAMALRVEAPLALVPLLAALLCLGLLDSSVGALTVAGDALILRRGHLLRRRVERISLAGGCVVEIVEQPRHVVAVRTPVGGFAIEAHATRARAETAAAWLRAAIPADLLREELPAPP